MLKNRTTSPSFPSCRDKRQAPRRVDDGARKRYFEFLDFFANEFERRFYQNRLKALQEMEKVLHGVLRRREYPVL